jgi:hypothetical protein
VCLVTGEAGDANLQEVLRSQHSPGSIRMKRERQIIFMGGVVFLMREKYLALSSSALAQGGRSACGSFWRVMHGPVQLAQGRW